jgi:hypothetical protein
MRCVAWMWVGVVAAASSACGRSLETKEELARAMAGASVATTGSSGETANVSATGTEPIQLPPSITVRGAHSGQATLSVNPVGAVVGLVGRGILFDVGYADYSVDGFNHLDGDLSVLANFEYLPALLEDPRTDFEVSLVGRIRVSGVVSDEARLNLRVKCNLADLTELPGQLKLRLRGSVTASQTQFDFHDEDVILEWSALAEPMQR